MYEAIHDQAINREHLMGEQRQTKASQVFSNGVHQEETRLLLPRSVTTCTQ